MDNYGTVFSTTLEPFRDNYGTTLKQPWYHVGSGQDAVQDQSLEKFMLTVDDEQAMISTQEERQACVQTLIGGIKAIQNVMGTSDPKHIAELHMPIVSFAEFLRNLDPDGNLFRDFSEEWRASESRRIIHEWKQKVINDVLVPFYLGQRSSWRNRKPSRSVVAKECAAA